MNKQMVLGFVFVAMSTFLQACEHDPKVCNYCFAKRTLTRLENMQEAHMRTNAFYTNQINKEEVTRKGRLGLVMRWRERSYRYAKSFEHVRGQLEKRGIIVDSMPAVSSKTGKDGFDVMLEALRGRRDALESEDLPS